MLERVRANTASKATGPNEPRAELQPPNAHYATLTVQQAVLLLDKIYDKFFSVNRLVKIFKGHFIKVEFLDKLCRPIFKEFDVWPDIPVEPEQRVKKREETNKDLNWLANIAPEQKMTRKSRPRIKEKEEKQAKSGNCEMCNTEYLDAALHRRSPHHLAFVRDHTNFLALDTLIGAGADVATFLDKATPLNGERRSLRKQCNGDFDSNPKPRRSQRSQSPDSTVNGGHTNGFDDSKKPRSRGKRDDDRQYYKVVGVSTKLRSSGGFRKRDSPPPTCNGTTKPLVVKFRKVRRSELSVLSDEAEQFMFPKRASSTSSTSSEEKGESPEPPPVLERRRLARPLALKEESSEEDSWPEDKRRRRRKVPVTTRRTRQVEKPATPPPEPPTPVTPAIPPAPQEEVNPLREEVVPTEKCLKWEDGKLKYTPAVEQLEFAFETVPCSEPWFETFKRQDQDKVATKNVPQYFALYTKSPKLPYEIGQLPPLRPNCCPLSDFVKREERAGPSRSYGTRGNKKQKLRKRTAALIALEAHPRKSPREHASTLAILGSAGLVHRRKLAEDSKSTASEDTVSETQSNTKVEPVVSQTQQASERLQQFLSEVYEDAADYDCDDPLEGEPAVTTSTNVADVLSLVSECDNCDIIREEIRENAERRMKRRGHKFKKKNRTGWPNKKKNNVKKEQNNGEVETMDWSSAEPPDTVDESTRDDSMSETEEHVSSSNETVLGRKSEEPHNMDAKDDDNSIQSDDKPLRLDVKVLVQEEKKLDKVKPGEKEKRLRGSESESEERGPKCKKKRMQNIGDWLQPVVRVARVETHPARRLRSAGKRGSRFR